MRSIICTIIITFISLTINAQIISFNALTEAVLGNEDALKRDLIESGWTMEKTGDEKSYGYAYKNIIDVPIAFIIFSDSYISCRSTLSLEDSVYDELYEAIKRNCTYNGVETFEDPPIDYISYSYEDGVEFGVYSEDGVFYIDVIVNEVKVGQ